MNEFLLVFRREVAAPATAMSPEQMQAMMKPWQDWLGELSANNQLANSGNRLASEGRVVKPNKVITNGPYIELKEAIGGYIIVKANSIDEATELAMGCPILAIDGNVEVRPLIGM